MHAHATRALFHRLWSKAVGTSDYVKQEWKDLANLLHMDDHVAVEGLTLGCPDASDLRALGWTVAVHNDYRHQGKPHTFWLLTHPSGRWLKGEAPTDTEALDQIRILAVTITPPVKNPNT